MNTKHIIALILVSLATLRPDARAAEVSYEAAFYNAFAPRTALDMVRQTPGFLLAEDEELRRGFAGAVGNVLIDGRRLSAKTQSPADVLQRIPAGEVLRIELLRGAEVAGDASGASVLANVVRTPTSGGGAWGLGAEIANRDQPAPNGWFGWGGRRGLTEYSFGGSSYALKRDLPGERTVTDGAGLLDLRRSSTSPREFDEYALNGQAARPVAGGQLTVTGQAHTSRYHEEATLLTTSAGGVPLENELTPFTESERTGEFGLNYQRAAGAWDLEVAGLATRKRYRSHVRSTHFDAMDLQDLEFTQRLGRDSGETILRVTGSRAAGRNGAAGRVEAGVELAVNTLDGAMQLALDFGAGPEPIPVPNSNLAVREQRIESFVSHAWPLDAHWALDSRLSVETSRLEFSGDTAQSVSLSYLKPRLQLTRTIGPHQLQARVYRDVGQLDFTDFVAAAEVADDVINGGNPDLRPQTAWALELDMDLRLPRESSLRVRGFRHWLDDVVDLVPAGPPSDRIDVAGNLGRGSLLGVEISARLPLSPLLPGGALKASGTLQSTDVRDAVTFERRRISELPERRLQVELRDDLPAARLSWGLAWKSESSSVKYRLREIDAERASRQLDAFVETTAIRGLTVRLTMLSILDDAQRRERRFYAPDRADDRVQTETSRWHPGHWWLLSMSGSF
jgi:TonB-dependent receptor-like protein